MTVMGNFLQFPTRSDTNWPVQSQKDRSLKFQKKEEEGSYYPCSKTQGADQLCSYCTADLRLCFSHLQKKIQFSWDSAHLGMMSYARRPSVSHTVMTRQSVI